MRYFTFLFFSFRQGLWNLVCILPLQHIMIELPVFRSLSSACGWWLPRGTMQLYRMNFGHKGASPSFSVSPPGFYSRGNSPQFLSSHFWLLNPSLWRLWSPLMGTREANTEQPRREGTLREKERRTPTWSWFPAHCPWTLLCFPQGLLISGPRVGFCCPLGDGRT